ALRHRLGGLRAPDAGGAFGRATPREHGPGLRAAPGAPAADQVRAPRPAAGPRHLGPALPTPRLHACAPPGRRRPGRRRRARPPQPDQSTSPVHAVPRITSPNTIRYQAKPTKSWLATKRISQWTQASALTKDSRRPTANSGTSAIESRCLYFQVS